MVLEIIPQNRRQERVVGKVTAHLEIVNRADEVRLSDGTISGSAVRRFVVEDVLVDTGATTLCLPQSIVDRLGLHLAGEVTIATATGTSTARVYEDAKISLLGRSGTFECIALPEGSEPLLGVIPLQRLGLEPDLQEHRLRILPDHGRRTYVLVPTPITHP